MTTMVSSVHEFGGVSTDLKLSLVEGYLQAFTTALRPKFSELWYIDAFAGTGERTVKHAARDGDLLEQATDERIERRRGSARIAIEVRPQFDRLIFVDEIPRHCQALQGLRAKHADRDIQIVNGDANAAISNIVAAGDWSGTRAVMFLDPYGMSVDWETLKAIRSTEAIDVWYLVSLAGLFRQAARQSNALDDTKRGAITRMLGTTEWETAWYQPAQTADLFSGIAAGQSRVADVDAIEAYTRNRLLELFPSVLRPLRLKNDRGAPQSSLFFAISNPEPKAIGLGTKIADYILISGRSSQVRPR